jgi:hypothetical protein
VIILKIKTRNEILNDVIRDGKKHSKDWNAVFGKDNARLSRDCYIFNPKIGVYLLKEYEKNPYETKGIGGLVARKLDEDVESELSKYASDFGIVQGDFKKIIKNIEKGIEPEDIFNAALSGKKDLGLSIPVKGHASTSKDVFDKIHNNLSSKQKKLDEKFEKIASDDGVYRSYD